MKTNITITTLILITFLNFSCSSDDSSSSKKRLLTDFTEPFLGFCISEEELLTKLFEPDDMVGQTEALYKFYQPQNGVEEVRYKIIKNQLDDEYLYKNTNVEFYPNDPNFEFMMDWLANKYGEPELTPVENYNKYLLFQSIWRI